MSGTPCHAISDLYPGRRKIRQVVARSARLVGKAWHGVPDLSGKRGTECPTCRESVARSARLVGKAKAGAGHTKGARPPGGVRAPAGIWLSLQQIKLTCALDHLPSAAHAELAVDVL